MNEKPWFLGTKNCPDWAVAKLRCLLLYDSTEDQGFLYTSCIMTRQRMRVDCCQTSWPFVSERRGAVGPRRPTLQGKSPLRIPFLGIAWPQPKFPHSCVCERFIYSQDRSTYFLQHTVKRARIICLMKMHPGSGRVKSISKCSMTPFYFTFYI